MNLHGQIMNLQAPNEFELDDSLRAQGVTTLVTAYKVGHRDARHAAAELALQANARIAELEAQLEAARAGKTRKLRKAKSDKYNPRDVAILGGDPSL